MSNVLVLVEHAAGKVKKGSYAGITFGQQYAAVAGGKLHLAVLGKGASSAAEQVKGYGAATVYVAEHPSLDAYLAESWAGAVASLAKACGATMIAGSATSTTKDLLPRVSARLDAAMCSDAMSIVDAKTFTRPMWAGNVIATVQLETAVKVCSVRGTEFDDPKAGAASEVAKHDFSIDPKSLKAELVSFKEVKSERPDVTTAERVVSGGRGVKGPEGFQLIYQLADALRAGVGASRAVCDAGWVPNDYQIGQTGKVVAPNLYIAVGISGAIQHLAGMKGSKVIVAINKDPEAPIFQVADYGLVADLFKAVPELIEKIK
jgi:electron transfer flavoprotein alpha subunit